MLLLCYCSQAVLFNNGVGLLPASKLPRNDRSILFCRHVSLCRKCVGISGSGNHLQSLTPTTCWPHPQNQFATDLSNMEQQHNTYIIAKAFKVKPNIYFKQVSNCTHFKLIQSKDDSQIGSSHSFNKNSNYH